ncbi:DeoR family transcriptional regulator [Streptococcus sanguinis SK1056]|uniref:DeoR family transcriptional regulator n=1 Tax=Streptococcus sanguinis SK1056 TaxID=888820 RepID=F3UDL0_STRSA|nr:HTH domain-containing protein [Streptococcus sanguinis]EGJ37836.1 DeoR family transcriptional regulator [Streptococcus sanguinis SK1056]
MEFLMNKSQRINDMLIFLNKKRQFNLKDIMNRYHISKSTALRDIASLETLGIPIYSDLGRNGSYKILSNDLLSPIIFSIDEISALYFSMLTLENYNMCPFDIDLQKLKEKFENSISEQQLSKITKIEKILQPEVRKTINNSQLRIILDILLHRQEEFFPIKYEKQYLQVQFIKLFSHKGDWYAEVINKDTGQKEELSCQSIEFYP